MRGDIFHIRADAHRAAERFKARRDAAKRVALHYGEPPVLPVHLLKAQRIRRERLFGRRRGRNISARDAHVGNGNTAVGRAERARAEHPVFIFK